MNQLERRHGSLVMATGMAMDDADDATANKLGSQKTSDQ
jgi:hypothetical protein